MDNPLSIIPLIWRSRKPSLLTDMKVLRNTFWLRKGYALTFFGTIITTSDNDTKEMSNGLSALKNHEMIHLKQAQSCGDSWMRFYLFYIYYWLRLLPLSWHHHGAAYLLNPFELEAYRHMYDLSYLERCKDGATEWRTYAKMKPKERLQRYFNMYR